MLVISLPTSHQRTTLAYQTHVVLLLDWLNEWIGAGVGVEVGCRMCVCGVGGRWVGGGGVADD